MIIEGLNAVSEALEANKTIEKVMVQEGLFSERLKHITALAREKKIKLEFVKKARMDALSETKRHQGAMAFCTEFQYAPLADALALAPKGERLVVLLDGLEDPHNLGAILRVADATAVTAVVIPRHRAVGVTDTVVRTSAGAAAHVAVSKVANINDTVLLLQEQGFFVYAADMDGTLVYDVNLTGDIAVVVGGEGRGVSQLAKKRADGVLSLPQLGKVNSLNASVATGAILYEAVRQRQKK